MNYIDTSVIVSALDSKDTSSDESIKILKRPEKVVSELVIAELNSVMFRNRNFKTLVAELSGDVLSTSYAVIAYVLERFEILYLPTQHLKTETPIGVYDNVIAFTIGLTNRIPLKTLDLLHISYALDIANSTRSQIEFITRDKEFETYKNEILEFCRIKINWIP